MAQNEGPRQENTQQPIRDSFLKHSGPSILHAQKACFACRRCGGAAGCELPPFGPSPTCLVERDQKPGGGPKSNLIVKYIRIGRAARSAVHQSTETEEVFGSVLWNRVRCFPRFRSQFFFFQRLLPMRPLDLVLACSSQQPFGGA